MKFITIIFILAVIGILINMYLKGLKEMPRCEWVITNCCPETAGAYWECVDLRNYSQKMDCDKVFVVCPQVLSPKPNMQCSYDDIKKSCVVR
ncbi:MAG: hypothetical protein QXQ18_00235 [Candidatus Aenigmatarchaeota archaeon]